MTHTGENCPACRETWEVDTDLPQVPRAFRIRARRQPVIVTLPRIRWYTPRAVAGYVLCAIGGWFVPIPAEVGVPVFVAVAVVSAILLRMDRDEAPAARALRR